jgi:hypothetical protein
VVAPARPGRGVAGCEQRGEFGLGEVADQVALVPFGRDGEHALDRCRVLGMTQGRVGEQRVDRCQPVVAGADAVVPVVLEVVQERGDERGVQIGDVQLAGLLAGLPGGELQQQAAGVR